MLHALLPRDLEDADAPIDLYFFADSKTIEIYEADIDVLEGGMECRFVIAVAWDYGCVWQGGEGED